jgi:hypothetical protein
MSKVKIIIAAFIAALALTAVAASSASAGWFVNGVQLSGSAPLATLAAVNSAATLHVPALPLKISCSGHLLGEAPEITSPNSGSATSLTFTACTVVEPSTCALSEEKIKTEAVTATLTLASGTADHVLFKPTSAKHFAEFELLGGSCSISGKKAVTGSVVLNAPTGQTESLLQALEGLGSLEQGSDELETANDKSYIEGGEALLKLESDSKWSFK